MCHGSLTVKTLARKAGDLCLFFFFVFHFVNFVGTDGIASCILKIATIRYHKNGQNAISFRGPKLWN